jgi:hypothetical protein
MPKSKEHASMTQIPFENEQSNELREILELAGRQENGVVLRQNPIRAEKHVSSPSQWRSVQSKPACSWARGFSEAVIQNGRSDEKGLRNTLLFLDRALA